MAIESISAERLRELLHYDPETGIFRWKVSVGRRCAVGGVAGTLKDDGYIRIAVDGRGYRSHRLAWLYQTWTWPSKGIDHINGKRSDNRWVNIREADQSENNQNRRMASILNRCGFLGVFWHKASGQWRAQIKVNGRPKHLGSFPSPESAHDGYLAEKRRIHPFNTL